MTIREFLTQLGVDSTGWRTGDGLDKCTIQSGCGQGMASVIMMTHHIVLEMVETSGSLHDTEKHIRNMWAAVDHHCDILWRG